MKPDIHPEYQLATVHCACGNSFRTRSTQKDIRVEICSVCHPFFTGRQKLVDTAGRVERFRQKWGSGDRPAAGPAATEAPEESEESEATAGKEG